MISEHVVVTAAANLQLYFEIGAQSTDAHETLQRFAAELDLDPIQVQLLHGFRLATLKAIGAGIIAYEDILWGADSPQHERYRCAWTNPAWYTEGSANAH